MSGTEAGLTWAAAMFSLLLSLVFFTSIKRFFSKTQPFSSFHANSNCNPISMPFDNSKAFLVSKDQVSQGFRPCSFTKKLKKQGRFYILGVRIKLDSLLNSTFSLSFWLGVGWQPKFARLVRSRHWILSPPRSVKGKPWILMIAFLRYLKYWVQTNRPRTNMMISHVFRMVSLKGESPILGGIYCSISRGVRRFVCNCRAHLFSVPDPLSKSLPGKSHELYVSIMIWETEMSFHTPPFGVQPKS